MRRVGGADRYGRVVGEKGTGRSAFWAKAQQYARFRFACPFEYVLVHTARDQVTGAPAGAQRAPRFRRARRLYKATTRRPARVNEVGAG